MIKLAIFASGSGSNTENIATYFKNNPLIKIVCVISNKKDAFVHQRAKKLHIPSFFFSKTEFEDGRTILEFLRCRDVDFIILAGFLLKIPKRIISNYQNRIINIHPALLPKYGGKGMYGQRVHRAVYEAHDAETGITIHFVNENYDEGKTIFQARCSVSEKDTPSEIARKVHALEYAYFPKVIEEMAQKISSDTLERQ